LKHWNEAEKKQAILSELEERGVLLEALAEEVGKDFDPFDLICHVAFDRPPLSRKARAERVKRAIISANTGSRLMKSLMRCSTSIRMTGLKTLKT